MSQKSVEIRIAQKLNISERKANEMFNSVLVCFEEELAETGKLKVANLGVFTVKERAARDYRNPRTGEVVPKPATNVIRFKAAKSLHTAVN